MSLAPPGGVKLLRPEPSLWLIEFLPYTGVEGDLVDLGDLVRYDDSTCLSCTLGVNNRLGYSLSLCKAILIPNSFYQLQKR